MHTYPPRSLVHALLLLGALSAASPAFGAPASAADTAQQAETHFQRGKALYKSGKNREAYEALTAAWSLKKSYDIASNLGSAELALGKTRDAAEHFAFAVRAFPAGGSKKQLGQIQKLFDEARKSVGALVIKVGVEGAEVLIDGKPVGRAPLEAEVYVEPGARTVEARLGGYEPATQKVQAATGAAQEVTLTPAAVVPAAGPGGTGQVEVAGPGPGPVGPVGVKVEATEVLPVPVVEKGPSTAVLATGGAVTGVAVVMGIAFAVVSNGKASDAVTKRDALAKSNGNSACTGAHVPMSCSAITDAIRGKNAFGTASAWSFIGAGSIGAATVIYALVAPRAMKAARVVVVPVGLAGGGGMVLGGVW